MRTFSTAVLFLFLFMIPAFAVADVREITAEGSYIMGDGETPLAAEERALQKAKRAALEEAGTYVESYSKVENLQLTRDEVQVLASGIMDVTVLEKKRTMAGEGLIVWVRISARIQTDEVKKMAARVRDRDAAEDYRNLRKSYEDNRREIDR